jgi:2-dehydro-3-deoxygalactonokinase
VVGRRSGPTPAKDARARPSTQAKTMTDRPAVDSIGRVIALDGGTSTTRARLLEDGRVIATARRAVGVRDTVLSGGVSPLAGAVKACLYDLESQVTGSRDAPIVAAGMLSAEVGLADVPHVEGPAGLKELAAAAQARHVPGVSDSPILFIPGVRTPAGPGPDGWADADVMRGEECETLGALIALGLTGPVAFLWPGSHSKLVEVDSRGRITRSHTTLTGEITAALAGHTLIAKSLPPVLPDAPDPEAVAAGMRLVVREGLGRASFLVRIADLTGALDPAGRAAFWIGAVIGDDAEHLSRHAILSGGVALWVGGRQPQRSLYAERLEALHPGPVRSIDDDLSGRASALGAAAVAAAAGWLSSR